MKNEADSIKSFGEALISITAALQPYQRAVDIGALCNRFGIPIAQDSDGDGNPDDAGVELPQPEDIEPAEPEEAEPTEETLQ